MLRVILDSRLRLPIGSRLVKTANQDVVVLCSEADQERKAALQNRGIRIEQIEPGADGHPDWDAALKWLGQQQITSVLIEGGSLINGSALEANIVDKVFLYYAARILGGMQSVPFASGAGFGSIASAARLKNIKLHRFDEDFAVEGYIRDPYAG